MSHTLAFNPSANHAALLKVQARSRPAFFSQRAEWPHAFPLLFHMTSSSRKVIPNNGISQERPAIWEYIDPPRVLTELNKRATRPEVRTAQTARGAIARRAIAVAR